MLPTLHCSHDSHVRSFDPLVYNYLLLPVAVSLGRVGAWSISARLESTGHDVVNCSPICGLKTLPRIIVAPDESSLIIMNDNGSPQIITERH